MANACTLELLLADGDLVHCARCGRDLPPSRFFAGSDGSLTNRSYCRDCSPAYQRENRARKRKSLTLQWPTTIRDDLLRPFLLGYFDGDGCATWNRGGARARERQWVLLGTEPFLEGARLYVQQKTGITLAPPRRMGTRNVFRIVCAGARAKALDMWLHEGFDFGLARKRV